MAGIYKKIKCDKRRQNTFNPTEYQSSVMNYFVYESTYKGLLLYHKLGAGKTCTSVLIADEMLRTNKIDRVYVLTPGSLRVNWIDEYCKKCGDNFISSNFIFMTYNSNLKLVLDNYNFDRSLVIIDEAHNIMNGVRNLSDNALAIYKKIYESNCRVLLLTGTPLVQYTNEWSLLGNLLNPGVFKSILRYDNHKPSICEDAFIPNVSNKDYQGIVSYYPGDKKLYPTTIYHNPIKCRMSLKQFKKYNGEIEFEKLTINRGPPKRFDPDYASKHMNFIRCIKRIPSRGVSNFYSDYKIISKYNIKLNRIEYLNRLESKYNKDRDEYQNHPNFELINRAYDVEMEIINRVRTIYIQDKDMMKNGITDLHDNHELESWIRDKEINVLNIILNQLKRQGVNLNFSFILNFDNPIILKQLNYYLIEMGDDEGVGYEEMSLDKYNTNWIDDGLINVYPNLLFEMSPKYVAILTCIVSRLKTKHVVFSFFKTGIGIETLGKLLGKCGISYGIFSGDIDDKERRRIIEVFNSVENRNGKLMNVLFITEAGAEGISLLEVNNMHIVESSTREHKITQAIGRVARIYSHVNMPQDRQYVNVWRYWSTPPSEEILREDKKVEVTIIQGQKMVQASPIICIDEKLYMEGQMYEQGKNVFLEKVIQNAIEVVSPKPEDMPNVTNYAYKLDGLSTRFYDVVDKRFTEVDFSKPNTYALLPFTTSTIKMPDESRNFLNRFPNIERMSGYYRVPHDRIWSNLETRNEPGSYIIVNNKNIHVIFAFVQQSLKVPKKVIDPLNPDSEPEKYKDRFINIERVLNNLVLELPIGSTIAIPSSIGTNGEKAFMNIIHDIVNEVAKTNTGIKFVLYLL